MSGSRLLVAAFIIWAIVLGILAQPPTHPRLVLQHAHLLDRPARNLPTLTP